MEDIKFDDYDEFRGQTLEFMKKILANIITVQNMAKDGKTWHAINKIDGLIDQVDLLAQRLTEFPEQIVFNKATADSQSE